jgi:hypothetical protein
MTRLVKNFLILFLFFALSAFGFSCRSTESENDNDSAFFDFTSDTEKAVALVREVNAEMLRIKILYNENQNALKELKEASQNRNSERVKTISKSLVDVINDGFVIADSAKSKLEDAQKLDIHPDYKEYLRLKEESLEKQIEAFQYLYDAARLLSDTAGSENKEQTEKARFVFKEKEENFQRTMEEAKKISLQADDLAKESLRRK